jgi:type VI secretion system protein ImpA
MADVAELLQPLLEGNPDLSYDEKRLEIERAFEAAATAEPGQSDPTDWRQIIKLILDQAERTRDVWLPVYLARAGARANRLETVELGCEYLAGLFEGFWDSMHPGLDDYGFQGRKGPCESLVRIGEFIGPLRRMVFVEHPRLGSFTGEDLERFAKEGESADNYSRFRAALDDLPPEEILATVQRLDRIRQAIVRADAVLTTHANGDTGTNFTATYAALDAIHRGLAAYAGADEETAAGGGPVPDADGGATVGAAPSEGGGAPRRPLESRDDVVKALDAVIDYYRRREPGSPVPVAIARAKNWVNMDFLTMLQDIAPETVAEARRVLACGRNED